MKRFIYKILLFCIPFLLWLLVVVIFDPYHFLSFSENIINNKLKDDISIQLNRPLFQLIQYEKNPTEIITLGDSRTFNLSTDTIYKYTNKKVGNLAYGAGGLQEMINTFWEIEKNHKLNEVYMGIGVSFYNKYACQDRVTEAISLKSNFISYAFSSYTFNSIFQISKSILLNSKLNLGKPQESKEAYWKYKLDITARDHFTRFDYPQTYFYELKKISDYCLTKNIKLTFFIPPSHTDLQKKVIQFNRKNAELRFKNDLQSLGDTYDFDFISKITIDKNNFNDPYHFNSSVGTIIIRKIFSDHSNKSDSVCNFMPCKKSK